MGHNVGRKRNKAKEKSYYRARRTRNHERMLDQIVLEDMLPENTHALKNQPRDEYLPGLGQHYCVTCAKYFTNDVALKTHEMNKDHKKRLRICLKEVPYTIEEAERAGGLMPAKK